MKPVLLTLFIGSVALAASPADFSGTWNLRFAGAKEGQPKTIGAIVLELRTRGDGLAGVAHIGSWPGDAPIEDAKVLGDRLTFTATGRLSSSTGIPTCQFVVTLSGEQMTATLSAIQNAGGPVAGGPYQYVGAKFTSPAIAYVDGSVFVDGERVLSASPLSELSVVRTESGRAEIRLRNGVLFLGENSSVRVSDNRPDVRNRLEILYGAAVVATGQDGGLVVCENDVRLSQNGVFRLDLHPLREPLLEEAQRRENVCGLRVYKGKATVQLSTIEATLNSGHTMQLNRHCGDMIPSNKFNVEDIDALDRWSRERVRALF